MNVRLVTQWSRIENTTMYLKGFSKWKNREFLIGLCL